MKMSKNQIKSFVLTGGPCAGKSEGIEELKKFLEELQYKVITIPEIATETRQNGFIHTEGTISQIDFQKVIFEMQMFKENLYKRIMAKNKKDFMILLLDRGLLDGKVYLPENEFQKILETHNLKESDILARYDAIFHLESTAVGDAKLYNNTTNRFRLSNSEQARIQNKKSMEVWSKHPNFHIISVEDEFKTKMNKLKEAAVNELEREKSFKRQNEVNEVEQ